MIKMQQGRSMVEMLGVLAIVGVLSLGGMVGYSKAMEYYKNNRSIDVLNNLVLGIKTMAINEVNPIKYENITTKEIAEDGIIDKDLITKVNNTYVLSNPYHGDILIDSNATNLSFIITMTDIPKKACAELASSPWATHEDNGLIALSIGEKIFSWKDGLLPMSLDTAMKECSEIDNSLSWEFQ